TVLASACSEITSLKQENPGLLSVETLYVPANAPLLVNGAISDFECAYSRYVVGTGLFTDELTVAISATANFDYDARRLLTNATYGTNHCQSPTPSSSQQPGIYTPLSTARATADTAGVKLEGWTDAEVPNRQKLIGQAYAYAGYSLTLMGEAMCSAAINLGPEIQPPALFTEAVARFTKAIAAATTANDATTLNLARVGRARARLNLGGTANLDAAAADAALVPATFVVNTSPDAVNTRRQNTVFVTIAQSSFTTVDPAYRNVLVPGGTTQDPRVAVTDLGRSGTATGSRLFIPTKDNALTAPIRLASYAEAQLIIAENAAATGDINGAVTAINNARSRTAGVPAYVAPAGATAADIRAQIIEERRREFFVEGHRLGDMRRYGIAFTPAAGTAYQFGGVYGTQTCFPLPDVERINNPAIAGATP
ncbi:MAG TPA: RagB/SusD family nutrient uptake outer membrane protein, partial [Gemmatimonadaceae bacterium]|nr:RagB/SusD family nutrient uptake outer membrane protein [Gemmatimonadaceae bacterium]